MGIITFILIVIIALIIIGIGWSGFFNSLMRGAEKVQNIPVIRNITDTAKMEFNKLTNNLSSNLPK